MSSAAGARVRAFLSALIVLSASCGRDARLAPKASAPAAAGFRLDSLPSGANVWVDGVPRGLTPVALRDLGPGLHRVRLEREGYLWWESLIGLAPGEVLSLPQAALRRHEFRSFEPERDPVGPLPDWPADRFPEDLEASVKSVAEGQRSEVTVRALGADAGELFVSTESGSYTCPLSRRELERFGWRQFVEVIQAGQQRVERPDPRGLENVPEDMPVTWTSLRAFGRTLGAEIGWHELGFEIRSRVHALAESIECGTARRR